MSKHEMQEKKRITETKQANDIKNTRAAPQATIKPQNAAAFPYLPVVHSFFMALQGFITGIPITEY